MFFFWLQTVKSDCAAEIKAGRSQRLNIHLRGKLTVNQAALIWTPALT